jgi:transcription elongation factor GreB
MRKGYARRPQDDSPAAVANYITPGGLKRLKEEHEFLLVKDRPTVPEGAAWVASKGDRSDNASDPYVQCSRFTVR